MLTFDTNLLGDYLDGHEPARVFLQEHETEVWGIASIVRFEAYLGALVGRSRGTMAEVRDATSEFAVLPVTDSAAWQAARLQSVLEDDGQRLGNVDALIAGVAVDNGARLATNDATLRSTAVRNHVDIVTYER
jgi:predicted nucleic acid-binding protein